MGMPIVVLLGVVILGSLGVDAFVQEDGSCHLLGLLPFSNPGGVGNAPMWPSARVQNLGYTHTAVALMAIDHFNGRNDVIVKELQDPFFAQHCTVSISGITVANTQVDPQTTAKAFLTNAMVPGKPPVCSVIGPVDVESAKHVDFILKAFDFLGIQYHSFEETSVNWRYPGGKTVSLVPTQEYLAKVILKFLQSIGRRHLVVVQTPEPQSRIVADFLRQECSLHNITCQSFIANGPPGAGEGPTLEGLDDVFADIRNTGYTAMLLLDPRVAVIEAWAGQLESHDLLHGPDYLHMIVHDTAQAAEFPETFQQVDPNSPLGALLQGALVVDVVDTQVPEENDPFLLSWRALANDESFAQKLNSVVPLSPGHPAYLNITSNYFLDHLPAGRARYIYDAVMLAGMGACRYGADNDAPPIMPFPQMTEDIGQGVVPKVLRPILDLRFHGASGFVRFVKEITKSRDSDDVVFGIYNSRVAFINETSGNATFEAVLTHILSNDTSDRNGEPQFVPIEDQVYIGGNGAKDLKLQSSILIFDNNYIQNRARGLGLAMYGLSVVLSLGCLIVLYVLRNENSILLSQPIFQSLLCLSSLILSTSILTLSFDEQVGLDESQLTALCTVTPWFFFIGHVLAFSAMFTKLWRLDKVLKFRRRIVTIDNVMAPLVLLMAVTICLLVAWTIFDPWRWKRVWISEMPPQMYGCCQSNNMWAFFGPLFAILVIAECLTLFFAMKTSDVPKELRETNYVLLAIATHIQAWCIGLPVMTVLGDSSTNAIYFGRVALIWIFSVSTVGLVVVPKLVQAVCLKCFPDLARPRASIPRLSWPASSAVRAAGRHGSAPLAFGAVEPDQSSETGITMNDLSDPRSTGADATWATGNTSDHTFQNAAESNNT